MLKEILGDFTKIEGILAAAVIRKDGSVIKYVALDGVNIETVGGMASAVVGTARNLGVEIKRGDLDQLSMEFNDGNIVITSLTSDEFLGLVSGLSVDLERIRYEIKKSKGKLRAVLQASDNEDFRQNVADREELLKRYKIREPDEDLINSIVDDFLSHSNKLPEEFKKRFPSLAAVIGKRNRADMGHEIVEV